MRINPFTRRRAFAGLLAAGALLSLQAMPATAAVLVVPAGCGPYSGAAPPAGSYYEDHSGDPAGLGSAAMPYQIPNNADPFIVGTPFVDYIDGTANDDVICGLQSGDVINGFAGDDELYGNDGRDTLSGGENGDLLSGGEGNDTLYGDALVPNAFDTGDTLQGGNGTDSLYGGAFPDVLQGGTSPGDNDFGDGGSSAFDICTGFEQVPLNCP